MILSIRSKLLLGFTVILVILVCLAVIMSNKLSESNARLTDIVNLSSKKVSLSKDLLIGMLEASRHEKNIILEKDPVKKEYYKDRTFAAIASVDEKIPKIQDLVDSAGARILGEFANAWKEFKTTQYEIIGFALKNENDKAFDLSIGVGLKVRDDAMVTLNRLIEKNELRMEQDKLNSEKNYDAALNLIIIFIVSGLLISIAIAFWIIKGITQRISFISGEAEKIASREYTNAKMKDNGRDELSSIFSSLVNVNQSFLEITENANTVASGDYQIDFVPRSSGDSLGNALRKMTVSLRETTAENEKHNWLSNGQNQLSEKIRGDQTIEDLSVNILTFISTYINANIGAFYTLNEKDNCLYITGKYAFSSEGINKFGPGEGIVGQAAQQQKQIYIDDLNEQQVQIVSTITKTKPTSLMVSPFLFEGKTMGVIEVGKLGHFTTVEREFFNTSMESIGISMNSAIARKKIQQLLEETQVQSEELQSQQEELKQVNEELEEQAQNLKQQQEELQQTNEELEEQTQALEAKNKEVEASKLQVEQKTKQLEITSKYKSEFLANMSHELRTPLNSLLILSKDLAENKKKNLLPDQVEGAEIIYKSGSDLLVLINEVLDLSKIEAGKMILNPERIILKDFVNAIQRDFKFQAEKKGLNFSVNLTGNLPDFIISDSQRLNQILKNLLSNALKFTTKGEIKVNIHEHSLKEISFSVADTGIGIPDDKQLLVFEAFHQADGGTSRKYGGTGLGLSISRELAKILGGEIKLQSKPDKGSVFTLILPLTLPDAAIADQDTKTMSEPHMFERPASPKSEYINHPTIEDDRENIQPGDKVVLIVEDDLSFAEILKKQANKKGFKCLAASTGEDGLVLTEKYKPNAIILDLDLPGINGHHVLSNLKSNPIHRHIPVHIISVNERTLGPIKDGAVEYLTKPVSKKQLDEAFNRIESLVEKKMKNLLIIEDDDNSRKAIKKLIGNGDVKCFEAGTGHEAIQVCSAHHIDCIVLDIGLPDISGFELIQKLNELKDGKIPPVIVYTGKELTREENDELQRYAETIIIKGVKSEERLLDETALFLHRTISNLPESKQRMINTLYDKETIFHSKKILLVDDDMRNIFALSKILKDRGMEIHKAENGLVALESLEKTEQIDLVLMDIMMPEMDGYEAMRRIRANPKYSNLPVIALTAKAMKEDKQKCIDAGANDYITKPVDVERLLSLMRVWLSK